MDGGVEPGAAAFGLPSPEIPAPCPSCGGTETEAVYLVEAIPLHSCVLLDSVAAARAFPRRDLLLTFCQSCGFAFNALHDEAEMVYASNFEESQHFSDTFAAFARGLAHEMADVCEVEGKTIVEIGCGKGEFLAQLCALGGARGIGIDPAYRPDPGRTSGAVRFLPELFGPAHHDLPADVVICRHTLEHIGPVRDFVRAIRRMVGARPDVKVAFETPDFARVLAEGAFWDIYSEHCSYFSAATHADLFRREGFAIDALRLDYGGQYIIQYAHPSDDGAPSSDPEAVEEMAALVRDFPARVRQSQDRWRDRVRQAAAAGSNVVLWGGGSKAVSFVTTLGLDAEVCAAIDINPFKQGKYLPGTGHPVLPPEALPGLRPGLIVIMNPLYRDEVVRQVAALGVVAEVVALE